MKLYCNDSWYSARQNDRLRAMDAQSSNGDADGDADARDAGTNTAAAAA